MADVQSDEIFAAMRLAAASSGERLAVAAADEGERRRLAGALAADGAVLEFGSATEALERLKAEPIDLVVLDLPSGGAGPDVVAAVHELGQQADLVALVDASPERCTDLYARDVAAVLPRPLPAGDALLRAHMRWLVSCRRSRARRLLLGNALGQYRTALREVEPALAAALSEIFTEGERLPAVMVMGDADLGRVAGGTPAEASPDVVVVGVGPADDIAARLAQARARGAGAALVVVDSAATGERLAAALYGGARACMVRDRIDQLGRVVASVAARRRAEVAGRRAVETLARFGVMEESRRPARAAPPDVDPRLIAEATAPAGAFVPSSHEVLVVDDEVVVLTVLREALRRGGYRVTTAASAEEAIELLKQRHFDLVLTDKNLPGASGLEVLRFARTLDPPPAVVLITGYSSFDSAAQALDIGAQDYIEKPVRDVEDLRFRVRRALSRRDQQIEQARVAEKRDGKGRVLVVELESERRQLIADYLARTYDVKAAADGEQALELLRQERYDVVLADRNLPGMTGLRVIEQAQRLLPHCASVLYTAYPSYESVKEAFEAGVDAYLVRPSEDLKLLAEKVAGALRGRGGIMLG